MEFTLPEKVMKNPYEKKNAKKKILKWKRKNLREPT